MNASLMRQNHEDNSIKRIPDEEVSAVLSEFARERNISIEAVISRLQSGNDLRSASVTLWLVIDPA